MTSPAATTSFDHVLPDWLASLRVEAVPVAVRTAAKDAILDTLAVGWAGSMAEGIGPVLQYMCSGEPGPSSLWGSLEKLSPASAALANGMLAAALDYDIVHEGATAHTHIVMLPALLALAEARNCSGRDFLAAYAGGCEVAVRLGMGTRSNPGWSYSSIFGVMAGAAACARLLNLDTDRTVAAVGIALSRAAGTQQTHIEGVFSKRLQTAFAARDALEAALLAECGATGPRQPFSGKAGFGALYAPLDLPVALVGLGEEWNFNKAVVKRFPSCFCNHAAIVAAQRAVQRPLQPDEIEACTVTIPPFAARLVAGHFDPDGNPQVAAQFSVQYSVANALVRGGLALADIAPDAVLHPPLVALARRVQVKVDTTAQDSYTPASVEVQLRDGSVRTGRPEQIPGPPAAPFEPAQWRAKAAACFDNAPVPLPARGQELLARRLAKLESLSSMRELLEHSESVFQGKRGC